MGHKKTILLCLAVMSLCSCGEDAPIKAEVPEAAKAESARGELIAKFQPEMEKLQPKINEIEQKRRSAPDFKCSLPEIPGHTLGENPACKK